MFFRDVKYIVPVIVQLGMFACPIIYSVSAIPERWRSWYLLNPMAVVIDGFRQVVFQQGFAETTHLWIATGIGAVLFIGAFSLFKRMEERFADAI